MIKNDIYTIFTTLIIIIIIIFLSYYVTLIIGKKSNQYFSNKNTKVLEKTMLSANMSIVIIQILDKVYILAVQNKNVTVIDKLELKKWNEYKISQDYREEKIKIFDSLRDSYNKILNNKRDINKKE
ncbi:MAG: flagellar biosynthetic protein FliO [Clostridiales bacterium]|nr:flagellar biosynthetic protein FliO [Clostridiales bacterium]